MDFASLPQLPRGTQATPEALRQLKVLPYGDLSLPAWRATRRSVLSVRLEAKTPWVPLGSKADGSPIEAFSDTCVPPSYPWHSVPVGWGSAVRQGDELTLQMLGASFDPRLCAFSEAQLSKAVALPILSFQDEPLVFAFRGPDTLSVLLPREVGLALDPPLPRVFLGAFVRAELSTKAGTASTLLAAFPATTPAAPPRFEVSIEVSHPESEDEPRVFLFIRSGETKRTSD